MMHELDCFFNPRSVAVIGVSRNAEKIGSIIFRNLLDSGYSGAVYAVNPNAETVFGKRCYRSVKDIGGEVDLAVVSIPAQHVTQAVSECAEKNVRACIIISAGFSETGNKEQENEIAGIAKGRMRIVGPNVVGLYDPYSGLDTVFNVKCRQGRPGKGGIAFVSQSGAFGAAMMDWCANEGVGLSAFVSVGNRLDVDEADMLDYFAEDEKTAVIAMYIESTKNGRRFFEKLRKAAEKKPVVVMKAGRSREGSRAAQSHTGSLAGSAEIYSGAFRQAGAVEAKNAEELFDFAKIMALPKPAGKNVQIITNGGGFGVVATDTVVKSGLRLASISGDAKEAIRNAVPPFAVVDNPIDLTGSSTKEMYEKTMETVLQQDSVDAAIVILLLQVASLESSVVESVIKMKKYLKPVIVCSTGGEFTGIHKALLESAGVPVYPTPERAVRALKALSGIK